MFNRIREMGKADLGGGREEWRVGRMMMVSVTGGVGRVIGEILDSGPSSVKFKIS